MERHVLTDGTVVFARRLKRGDVSFDLLKRSTGIGTRDGVVEQLKLWINGSFANEIGQMGNVVQYCFQRKRKETNRVAFQNLESLVRVKIVDKGRDYDAGTYRVDTVFEDRVRLKRDPPAEIPSPPERIRQNDATLDKKKKKKKKRKRFEVEPSSSSAEDAPVYRSKLERKWSRFFDYLKRQGALASVDFEPSVHDGYTPDFLLTDAAGQRMWMEIKPIAPSIETLGKIKSLEDATGIPAFVCWGEPRLPFVEANTFVEGKYADDTNLRYRCRRSRDSRPWYWVERGGRIALRHVDDPDVDRSWNTVELQNAYAFV